MDTPTRTHAPDVAGNTRSAAERLFAGPGAARVLARSIDWASSRLGPVDAWPQSLRTAVDVCLGSRFATALLWGPDLTIIHNDAHIAILGTRFPAMGRPASEALSDIWPVLGPLVANVLVADVAVGTLEPVDVAVTFDRGGAPRPGHLTVSFSAVHDESGRPGGVMIVAVETTARLRAEAALRESEEKYRVLVESLDEALAPVVFNITERKRVEATLQETRHRLEEALATARMAYWNSNPATDTTFASASMEELFGLPSGERFGSSAQGLALVHPDDRERYRALVREASARAEGWHTEFRIVRPRDGAILWLEERGTVTIDPVTRATHTKGLVWDITDRKRAEAAAESVRIERERLALHRQLAAAEEDERRRLARELHDEVGQHLTALGLGLQALSNVVPANSEVDRRAAELSAVVSTMGQKLHDVAVRLRPKALEDFGLEAAIAAYADEWSRRSGIEIDVHAREGTERLPVAVEGAVYRIVQEALTNVARHSGATRAGIVVERRDGDVVAIVEDNGHGGDAASMLRKRPPSASGGLGLVGIRERAALLGGTVDVESTPAEGTTLFVRIPIEPSIDAPAFGGDETDDEADA